MMRHTTHRWLSLVVVLFACMPDASAQTMDTIAIHGFGGWAYGKTDNENRYLMGNEDGNYDAINFSLNISANPYEKLSLHIQPSYTESMDGSEVGLDYAFAEWYVADALTFRIGKVKAPFMLATEVYDVGTIRPFFSLPQGMYQEMAAEAYKGAGLTGSFYTRNGWELQYDFYGGQLSLLPNRYLNANTFQFGQILPEVNNLLGGRLIVQTPLTGFNTALSAYSGDFDFINQENLNDHYLLFGASAEYLSDRWWLRSEYLMQKESPEIEIDVVYAEAAYKITPHWQVAARYEHASFDVPSLMALHLVPESVYDHQEVIVGLNYWLNPNMVLKLSYHMVDGNRLAFPETVMDYLQGLQMGSFEEQTNLILMGVQFSF
jgi:hypothetical protein